MVLPPVILTINAGSSSVRLAAFRGPDLEPLASARYEGGTDTAGQLAAWLGLLAIPTPTVVAHRLVHGGARYSAPCLVNPALLSELPALSAIAPLHNPPAIGLIHAARSCLGESVPQVAVFDTGFYRNLPAAARSYALPAALCKAHDLRRYGFHGLAHESMLTSWGERRVAVSRHSQPAARVISLQLGAGCSITASVNGAPIDTSMGFSPLEGLVMATRSGDLDPGILLYLLRETGMALRDLDALLNRESGLLGLSGLSGDVSRLLATDSDAAHLALDVYCRRITKYVGAYLALLGGADAILFGGGVGENVPAIRQRVLATLGFAGVNVDTTANLRYCGDRQVATGDGRISPAGSPVEVWVIPVNEAKVLASAALQLADVIRPST